MIPKKIHYCWFGGAPKSKLAKKCIKSWKKKCPDYEIIEWNESNYDVTKIPFMKEAYDAKKWGFVPDYARLDIIYNNGGIYLDTDVEIVKSLDDLLATNGFAGYETEEFVALGLGFGAEKHNPVIKSMMKAYEDRHFLLEDGTYDMTPSPRIDTPTLRSIGFDINGEFSRTDSFTLLSKDYLCPLDYNLCMHNTENTHTIHWFAASWESEEFQASLDRKRKLRQKAARWDKIRYFPNRLFRKVIGDEKVEMLKMKLKRK